MATMRFSMILCAAMAPATVLAAPVAPPAPGAVQRLTDAQVEQVLAEAAAKREAAEAAASSQKLEIHGEVGVEVGTGGHRALYGTAFVPLGEEGGAVVTFSTATGRDHDHRRGER